MTSHTRHLASTQWQRGCNDEFPRASEILTALPEGEEQKDRKLEVVKNMRKRWWSKVNELVKTVRKRLWSQVKEVAKNCEEDVYFICVIHQLDVVDSSASTSTST